MNYKYDIASCTSELFQSSSVDFKPDNFSIEQVFYASADGTKIPMFIICK
jgi:prolyl oligopeptidase